MLMEDFPRLKEFWNLIEDGIPAVVLTLGKKKAIEDLTLKAEGKETPLNFKQLIVPFLRLSSTKTQQRVSGSF